MKVLAWFLWRRDTFSRRVYARWVMMLDLTDFPSKCHNDNLYGCRKHPLIYNDMCRIVREMK